MAVLDLDEKDLKSGVLGLVVALVEIIKETLRLEAVRRMESGSLTEEEVDRLGEALMDLDTAIERIKVELGVMEAVKSVRDGLDSLVNDALDTMLNPARWAQETGQVPVSHQVIIAIHEGAGSEAPAGGLGVSPRFSMSPSPAGEGAGGEVYALGEDVLNVSSFE